MKEFLERIYSKYAMIYKGCLMVATLMVIMYFLPRGLRFKYEYQYGKPWVYETLYSPFEFSIKKTDQELMKERKEVEAKSVVYYSKDTMVLKEVLRKYKRKANVLFSGDNHTKNLLTERGEEFLRKCYDIGVFTSKTEVGIKTVNLIGKDNGIYKYKGTDFVYIKDIDVEKEEFFSQEPYRGYVSLYNSIFLSVLQPNIVVNKHFTDIERSNNLDKIVTTRGLVEKGDIIVSRGEIVSEDSFKKLKSLQDNYDQDNAVVYSLYSKVAYMFLAGAILAIIMIYLRKFNYDYFHDNTTFTFIITNMLIMFICISIAVRLDYKYVYIIPLGMLPIIFKSFFDIKLGLFIHIMTVLLCSLVVGNSFQFAFISIVSGGLMLLSKDDLHYRVTIFLTAILTTVIYTAVYFMYKIVSDGSDVEMEYDMLLIFVINGVLMLFSNPIIYIYEKVFGLISDASLLELLDTNSPLLRQLSEKAPGTFQHSMQVANLAEAAATEVNANSLLVRVGAFYHDIGKIENPLYFTENQKTSVNPHDELTPIESAKIIIGHVLKGIEIARKNNIPDRIIDFIRTHHGDSYAYYFYKKQLDMSGEGNFDEKEFRYKGPIPFSKETVILMMADSVEAASKSLENPNYDKIKNFVDIILRRQFEEGQYLNSDITLRDMEKIKKVLVDKLVNIYHLRVKYPE